jgi:hypothetical protein
MTANMAPAARKLALTVHVTCSVGWLGAVVGSLAGGITGLLSQDEQLVRAIYLTLAATGWSVLVPFSVASLLTGFVLSLGTRWGVVRHYWVLLTLTINVVAIVVLLLYVQTLTYLAEIAARAPASGGGLMGLPRRRRWSMPGPRCCCCSWPPGCRCTSRAA